MPIDLLATCGGGHGQRAADHGHHPVRVPVEDEKPDRHQPDDQAERGEVQARTPAHP
jgi:hypothetical protein